MKIAYAINNLASAINNLADTLKSKNSLNVKPYYKPTDTTIYKAFGAEPLKSKTLNPTQYTTSSITYTTPKDFVTILKSEHVVIGNLYKALTSNDPQKDQNDKVMLDIKDRWPKLYYALIDIISAKTFSIYKGFSKSE